MGQPLQIACEICGATTTCVMQSYVDSEGKPVECWKAVIKKDGAYVIIDCKYCGEREQLVLPQASTSDLNGVA